MTDTFDTSDTVEVFGGEDGVLEVEADKFDAIDEKKLKDKREARSKEYIDHIGRSLFGERFERYMKVDEYRHLLPAFKEHYYECRIKDPKSTITHIIRSFNEDIKHQELGFFPYPNAYRGWRKKWDKDLLEKRGQKMAVIDTKKNIQQVLKTRNASESGVIEYATPSYESLEETLQTFGGELLNDAMTQMRNDQDLEDMFESDELMRRKNHVLNVFSHVTKMVHSKASLMLKTSEEKRNNASFLMDLMKKSTSGQMTVEEIQALKVTYAPKEKQNVSA